MIAPTVAVTCQAADQSGQPVAGAVYTATLNQTEISSGLIAPESVAVVANSSGVATLNLWPNALGTAGSLYRIKATNPENGKKFFDAMVRVPNTACFLHQIIMDEPTPALDSAQQALADAQALLAAGVHYYGALTTNPTANPLGGAVVAGDLYFNTALQYALFYTGTTWQRPAFEAAAISAIDADVLAVDNSRIAAQAEMQSDVQAVEARKAQALTTDIPAAIDSLRAFNVRGAWTTAAAYALKDVYTSAGIAYVVLIAHTSTSIAADLAAGKAGIHQGATTEDLFNKTDVAKGAGMVGYDSATVAQRLDRMLHIEGDNYRDFWNAMAAFNMSEDGNITISSYGDSVSADLAKAFAYHWISEIGFANLSSFTPTTFANPLVTPTGNEAVSRVPASRLSYALAGGATYSAYDDGGTPDPVYAPNSDQRWTIPVSGSVTFNKNAMTFGFQRMIAFFAIEPGAGSCTVEVRNQLDAVVATQTINCVNATLGATKAEFTGLDTTKTLKLVVTGTDGTVTCLGAVLMFRRGVTLLSWQWGGSTFIQQNKSSKVIFDYINNALGTSIVFAECKGETSTDGVVGGVDGLVGACARLNALNASKVFIGSRPDNGTEASQYDQIYRFRDNAAANGYVFIDGYNLLKSYAELQRLAWDRRNNVVETVHLPDITAYYVCGFLIARFPRGFFKNLWHTRKVFSPKVCAASLNIIPPSRTSDEPNSIAVIIPYPNDPSVLLAKVQNVASYKLKNPYSTATAEWTMYGAEANFDAGIRALAYNQNGTGVNLFYGENRNAGAINQNTYTGTNQWSGGLALGKALRLPGYTVSTLPPGATNAIIFVTNGRKIGEGAGAGTGVPVYYSGANWLVFGTDAPVLA